MLSIRILNHYSGIILLCDPLLYHNSQLPTFRYPRYPRYPRAQSKVPILSLRYPRYPRISKAIPSLNTSPYLSSTRYPRYPR